MRFAIFCGVEHGYYASCIGELFSIFLVLQCLLILIQELVSFVHQQAAIVEELSLTNARQSVLNEELLVTIHEQSAFIQQLKQETGVKL